MSIPEHNGADYQLLAKYIAGEASSSESEQVEAWLSMSDANLEEFQRLNGLWTKQQRHTYTEFDSRSAWEKVSVRLKPSQTRGSGIRRYVLPIAAALLGIAVIALVYRNYLSGSVVRQMVFETTSKTGELTLADGSVVHLNKASALSYPSKFEEERRTVSLKGEAFFEVSRDTARPFVIDLDGSTVEVLGTSFDVKADGQSVVVSVETGQVRLGSASVPTQRLLLEAGDRATYDAMSETVARTGPSNSDYLFWKNRTLTYSSVPLKVVVEQLNVHYGSHVSLADTALYGCLLSTKFEDMELEQIIKVLSSTFMLDVEKTDDRTVLSGEGCRR